MKIALLDDYTGVALEMADWNSLPAGCEPVAYQDNLVQIAPLAQRLHDFEVVCAMRERTPFPAQLFQMLPHLKLLITTGMRNAAIDMEAAVKANVVVCGTDIGNWDAAELTWGLLLACARNITHDHHMMQGGGWHTRIGTCLHGKTLGILGLGHIGEQVAGYAKAFGMPCIAWSQNLTPQHCRKLGVEYVDKDTLFQRADFITIHVVLSERTRDLVSWEAFSQMKPTAFLVNTSRGPIVNQAALIDALQSERIRGAALDVYETEPLPEAHILRTLDNLVTTPHTGYVTHESYQLMYSQVVEDIQAWLQGTPVRVLG